MILKRKFRAVCAGLLLSGLFLALNLAAEPKPLSLEEAVSAALNNDPGVESANWDWLSATAKAEEAHWKMAPSLSVSGSYQRLSDLPSASFGALTFKSPVDAFSFAANLQYPVFAGFRIREAAEIADLQAETKLLGIESVKRALVFEVRRAYWEAVRAMANVETLRKNLELTAVNRDLTAKQALQGTATQIDQLTADLRYKQADLDLGDAVSFQHRAFLVLSALTGNNGEDLLLSDASLDGPLPFSLTTGPDKKVVQDFDVKPDEKALIGDAISRRPETRLSALSIGLAEHGQKIAEAGLYPTVSLTGNYTYAAPNNRVFLQKDPPEFIGTWSVGIMLSYDIGSLPVNLKETEAQTKATYKAQADKAKQQNSVVMDVRSCLLSLARTRRDLALVQSMVDQARENVRVMQQKLDLGIVGSADLLNAQLTLLRSNFTVTNKQIDLQVAAADLARALALDEIR